jgi:hypothetical protein
VAQVLRVRPEDVHECLLKKVGDDIALNEVIARKQGPLMFTRRYSSPVEGRLEKILPSGTLLVRERPELATVLTAVEVAKELGVDPRRLGPYLRCEVGQEVDRGQWLAAIIGSGDFRLSKSPVRGVVDRIDHNFGIVLIAPLLEELEIHAWLPGMVQQITDRGCDVSADGTMIHGVWGSGGEVNGELSLGEIGEGRIVLTQLADSPYLEESESAGVAGVITGGLDLIDVLEPYPKFTVVVTDGFGRKEMDPELYRAMSGHCGRLALMDGTTQLRVGVRRPTIILPH